MIQKNNPLLLKNETKKIVEKYIEDKSILNKIRFIPQSAGLILLVQNVCKTIENGFRILEVKADEFDSGVSRKTIEGLTISNILMPFDSFCVKFKKESGEESIIFINNKRDSVIFSKEFENTILSCKIEKDDKSIKESLKGYTQEAIDMILDSISTTMYFTAFKNEKKRVQTTKIPNKNIATKKFAKTISIIKLNGVFYSNRKAEEISRRESNDKAWIVKGHWRSQPIGSREETEHKIIWIDCFWKGSGKEQISKIYKLN
jgi:hypothetical protein